MVSTYTVTALAALSLASVACRPAAPPSVDAELAACVPGDTLVLAGIHLDQLRANPLFQKLSRNWSQMLEPFRDASYVWVAYNGRDLLFIAHGEFRTTPAGASLLTPQLALAGPADIVRTATAQHATGRTGVPSLVAISKGIAARPVWAVVLGGRPLPITGNSTNLNWLLRFTESATFSAELDSRVTLHATGVCHGADAAGQVEETLRGLFSLAAAAARDRDLSALLDSVQIRRDDATVRADLAAAPDALEKLLREVAR